MGNTIEGLLRLQSVERQLTDVRSRLKTRKNAVAAQQRRIDQLRSDFDAMHAKSLARRKDADRLELDLQQREAEVSKLRTALNTAKTNKEYAAILTQINTLKADNAKLEEEALKVMQDVDAIRTEGESLRGKMEAEEKRLAEIESTHAAEVERLSGLMNELTAQRTSAAAEVPSEVLALFNRIAENYDGDAMAVIEVQGRRPPHEYVCGGCFMSLNAEHANVLRTRDEIRRCDNCGRILYLETDKQEVDRE